jgi:hypothetical protein
MKKIFEKGQSYRIVQGSGGRTSIYTIKVTKEDDDWVYGRDIYGVDVVIRKSSIDSFNSAAKTD